MEKSEISIKKAVSSIILRFMSYAVFICFIITFFGYLYSSILSTISEAKSITITICISLMLCIAIYYLAHLICRASIYNTFKYNKLAEKDEEVLLKKLNKYFILFLILSFLFCLLILFLSLNGIEKTTIASVALQKETFSDAYTNAMSERLFERLNFDRIVLCIQYAIFEIGIIVSILSIIPYQKKMLKLYNK